MQSWLTKEEYQSEISAYERSGKLKLVLCFCLVTVLIGGLFFASQAGKGVQQSQEFYAFKKSPKSINRAGVNMLRAYEAAESGELRDARKIMKMVKVVGPAKQEVDEISGLLASDELDVVEVKGAVDKFLVNQKRASIDPAPSAYLKEMKCLVPPSVVNESHIYEDAETLWNKYLSFSFC